MLTVNLAIVAPVTEADDRTAREAVWQQVTERIVPQMGKLCTRFEPSGGRMGTESVQSIQRHSGQERTGAVPVLLRICEAAVG